MATTTGKSIAIVTGSALGLGYELASQLIDKRLARSRHRFQRRTPGRAHRTMAR